MVEKVTVISEVPDEMALPLEKNGIKVNLISPNRERVFLLRYLKVVLRLIISTKAFKPDLFYADGEYGFLSVVIGRSFQIPVFVRIPGNIWVEVDYKIGEALENNNLVELAYYSIGKYLNYILDFSTVLITVSEDLEVKTRNNTRLESSRIFSVPVPIQGDEVPCSRDMSSNKDEKITILTVTDVQFGGKKEGLKDSIKVTRNIIENNNSIEHRIAYDGDPKDEIEQFIDNICHEYPVYNNIFPLGYVEDIDKEYSNSDIFFYISYLDGYPKVVLEAQLASLPVVVNSDFGMIEQVEDERTGILLDTDEFPENAERALRNLISDPDKRRRIGKMAHKKVRSRNSPKVIGKELLDIFSQYCK